MREAKQNTSSDFNQKVGFRNDSKKNSNKDFSLKKRSHFILPPPAILEAYEQICSGATDRLISMAEEEQKHRHNWEDAALRKYVISNRLGKIFGSFLGFGVLITTSYLAILGQEFLSIVVAVAGFGSLLLSSLVTLYSRRYERKPRVLRQKNPPLPANTK